MIGNLGRRCWVRRTLRRHAWLAETLLVAGLMFAMAWLIGGGLLAVLP